MAFVPEAGGPRENAGFRFYDLLVGGFVAVLLCSNLIGPGKTVAMTLPLVGVVTFGAGNIFFPVSYIFGDVLTEVYGYARARRAIWAGFGAMLFAALMGTVVVALPAASTEPYNRVLQPALELVFGNTWRITAASICAFWVGDFANSFVLAKLKVITRGRFLWMRTIGSTIVGQGVDSLIFYPVAFAGIWSTGTVLQTSTTNWAFKVGVEVLFTPVTYVVIGAIKRAEREDHFDVGTRFTPFSLR